MKRSIEAYLYRKADHGTPPTNRWRKRMLLGVLSFFLLMASQLMFGQADMYLHLDKGFYVSGERVWYTIYLTQTDGSPLSKGTVSLGWYNQKEELVGSQQFGVANGRAQGSYFLNDDLAQGNYVCRISSPNLLPSKWLMKDYMVPVLAPDITEELSKETLVSDYPGVEESSSLSLDKSIYTPGENVSVRSGAGGLYSISVIDLEQTVPFHSEKQLLQKKEVPFTGSASSMDLTKWNLKARITKNNGKPLPGLVGVYWVERDTVYTVRPVDGEFILQLPFTQGVQHFQVMDSGLFPDNEFSVSWENYPAPIADALPEVPSLGPLSEKQKAYAYWYKRRQLLNRIFQRSAPVMIAKEQYELSRTEPERVYDAQSYLAFQDLESFCKEVLAGAMKIEAKGSRKGFKMLNYDSKLRYQYEPLVIVDDMVLKDPSQIWEINWKNMDKIELYATHKSTSAHFGSAGVKGGVLKFATRGKQQLSEKLDFLPLADVQGLSIQESFYLPNEIPDNIPDIRPLVYWDGKLGNNSDGLSTSYLHSDVKGKFLIQVKGLTASGEWVEMSQTYNVQ